ncbi:MAG TPA: right-handed parallel beta-helix repeat-containing protein [Humisphaera sp.]
MRTMTRRGGGGAGRWLEPLEGRRLLSTYTVTGLADAAEAVAPAGPDSFAATTLRAAVTAADAHPGADVIRFMDGLAGTISLRAALPRLAGTLAIRGPGAARLTVERSAAAGADFSIFSIEKTASVTIAGLKVARGTGTLVQDYESHFVSTGGGIYSEGTLRVDRCVVEGNRVRVASGSYQAAGITSTGSLVLTDSTVAGNDADGVFVDGRSSITNCSFSRNEGAGLGNRGTSTVRRCVFADNRDAGCWNNGGMTASDCRAVRNTGSGIANYEFGQMSLRRSTVSGNTSTGSGGGIATEGPSTLTVEDCTITRNRAASYFDTGGGGVGGGGDVTMRRTVVSDNSSATGSGGGIALNGATLTDCTISGNTTGSGSGGGVYLTGDATLTRCSVLNNSTGSGDGAGIYASADQLTILNCTVAGNRTLSGDGAGIRASGSRTTIIQSTIAGNVSLAGCGGGINGPGSLTVRQSTIVRNSAASGGGVYQGTSDPEAVGEVQLYNCIVSQNRDGWDAPDDVRATVAPTSAFNLIGTGGAGGLKTGTNGNRVGVTPDRLKLAPLALNGGPTRTIALLLGSVAIDTGGNAQAVDAAGKPLTTDQRGLGFGRIVGGRVDVGAFEWR